MKKKTVFLCVALGILLTLAACASGEKQSGAESVGVGETEMGAETVGGMEAESITDSTEAVVGTETENGTENAVSAEEEEALPANEAFARVLKNERKCICTDNKTFGGLTDIFYTYKCCLNEIPFSVGNYKTLPISEFAVADIDGNGVPEVVLAISDFNGFVILRYVKGEIWGNIIGYRSMIDLRENGICHSSGGWDCNSEGTFFFIGDAYMTMDLVERDGENYYVNGIPVSEDEWRKEEKQCLEFPCVTWYAYTEESIETYVAENETLSGITASFSDARQDYLDGWFGLLAMTYDETTGKKSKDDAWEFYDACDEELEKIAGLCAENLETDEAKQLWTEYEEWHEAFDARIASEFGEGGWNDSMEISKIYSYGRVLMQRAYYYVDLYFHETESITVSTETTLQQDVMVMEPIGYVDNDGDTPAVLDILSSLPEQNFTSAQKYEDVDWKALEKSGDEVVVILAEEEQNGVTVYGYKGGAYGARGMAVRYDGAYSYFDYAWDRKQWHGELAVKDFNADGEPEIYFIFQGAIGTGVNADRLVVFEPGDENGGLNAHEFHAGGKLGEILSFTVSEDDRLIVSQNGIEKKSIDLNDDRDGVYAREIYAVDDTSQISYSVADDGILMATNVGVWFEKGGPGVFLPDDAGKMEFEVTYTDGEFGIK